MSNKNSTNAYDDNNIPEVDLPQDNSKSSNKTQNNSNSVSTTQSTNKNSGGE